MTPKEQRILRHEREVARGREVQERAARQDTINRWIKARKIHLFYDASADEARVYIGDELVLRTTDKTFPTELDIAQVGLAIKALSDFQGVEKPDPPPQPKSACALHVAETQRRLQMDVKDLGALIGLEPLSWQKLKDTRPHKPKLSDGRGAIAS